MQIENKKRSKNKGRMNGIKRRMASNMLSAVEKKKSKQTESMLLHIYLIGYFIHEMIHLINMFVSCRKLFYRINSRKKKPTKEEKKSIKGVINRNNRNMWYPLLP